MLIRTNVNKKTKFTKMCISEAILILLQKKEFSKLKISEIVKKAGVARMTFYKYYDSPQAALTDYLQIVVSEYINLDPSDQKGSRYMSYEHILYSLKFFDQYAFYFLTLSRNNLQWILLDGINRFMAEHITVDEKLSVYDLYAYAGGLLNVFLKWEEEGKKDSAEMVAKRIYYLYRQKEEQQK